MSLDPVTTVPCPQCKASLLLAALPAAHAATVAGTPAMVCASCQVALTVILTGAAVGEVEQTAAAGAQ